MVVTVGVDFDGVLCYSAALKARLLEQRHGIKCCPQMYGWRYLHEKGLMRTQFDDIRRTVYGPEYRHLLAPVPGSIECLLRLIREGAEPRVITSRIGEELDFARDWLRAKCGHDIQFVGTGRGKSKGPALLNNNIQIYLDDDLKKLKMIIAEANSFSNFPRLFLFHQCRSSKKHLPPQVERLQSLAQFPDVVFASAIV